MVSLTSMVQRVEDRPARTGRAVDSEQDRSDKPCVSNLPAILRHVPPFDAATDRERAKLAGSAATRNLQRGEVLWRAGETPGAFTILRAGLVKIVRRMPNGRDAIVGVFGPRESVGEVALVRGTAYPADAIVCSDTACIVQVPKPVFLAWSTGSQPAAARMAALLADRVQTMHATFAVLSAGSVESRLATLLLDFTERFGDELEDGSTLVPIALSRQELANLVSTSQETAIRVMSRWQKSGVLDTRPDGFVLRDIQQLRQAASAVLGGRGSAQD